jgi:hypothetical protein
VVGLKYGVVNEALQRIYLVNNVFVQILLSVFIGNTAYRERSCGNVQSMLKYAGEGGF